VVTALYDVEVRHVRHAALHRDFRHHVYLWLVDLDALPRLPRWLRPFAGFRAADHLGDPRGTIRGNLDRYLAGHGIDLRGGRVLMLANARVLGHVFNPTGRGRASSRRSTTPTANGTATSSPPTTRAGRGRRRTSTCRPSWPSTASTACTCPCPTSG
jgi:hypothetical protein